MGATVVTGIGIIAPNGVGADDFWSATLNCDVGIGPISRFDASDYPVRLAGEVTNVDVERLLPNRLIPQTDRVTRLALLAAEWALNDADVQLESRPEFGKGTVTASSAGGFEFGQGELEKLWSKGPEYVSAYQSFAWFYAVNTGQISIRHGLQGPGGVVVTEQAGGLDAVAQARRQIWHGTGLLVTGGVDASLCPWGWVAQLSHGRLSTQEDPHRAYLPFDVNACGYVPGEGGAILILEDAASARERGCRVYGRIAGYGATFDPRPGSGREPGLRRAIETALADADVSPVDIDVVFADGAGLPTGDRDEATAIERVFGTRSSGPVPVTVPKTMTGRLYSGGSALDLATAFLALDSNVIPPTANVTELSPECNIDLVLGRPREHELTTALILARGYGGFNSAMVVRADA
ncbi:ketosynthase chain-length factor [Nocardiopsis rhodophaea]|uniref:Ketosynthase chain-length factor n=1 Tax=Nocardiopsis rhodophaea TaxID=280238 RepID=A0ABP5EYA0_9ACTN